MKKDVVKHFVLVLGVFLFGSSFQSFAQVIALPEVKVSAVNHKYLSLVDDADVAKPVKQLEGRVATFDLKSAGFYEEKRRTYFVSFTVPKGVIQATYNKDGKIMRSREKFKDVPLPKALAQSIAKKYPEWGIVKGNYLVNYSDRIGASKKYRIRLENGNKRQLISINERGEFI